MLGFVFGYQTIRLDQTDSTNSYAARLLHESVPREGTAILTQFQVAGKGQRGTAWASEEGKNLLVSYILYPKFILPTDQFLLSQVVSLAVAETVTALSGKPCAVKWPNDVLVEGRKIAGILIENAIRNNALVHAIVGIGFNVNQERFPEFQTEAVSIRMLTGREADIKSCYSRLNLQLEKWYLMLQSGNYQKIRDSYSQLLFRKGIPSSFESQGQHFTGIIRGVNVDGSLDLETEDGKRQVYRNKEIRFTGPAQPLAG